MSQPNNLILIFFIFTTLFTAFLNGDNVAFNFRSFTLRNLTLLGDSHLRDGVAGLTRELGVPSSSSGTIIYTEPILFYDQDSNTTASFSTNFTFSIQNTNPESYGDGLAFFLSPDNTTLGSPGGYLGLVNSSQLTKNRFVAVEFDTRLDSHFDDPNNNHVGLDIESLNSIKTADPVSIDIDLKSGKSINCWIDYKNDLRVLTVFLSYSESKPLKPLMSVGIDLAPYLKQPMYLGFSGSTEGSTEIHLVENWSFQTFGFVYGRPNSHSHNVADNSITVISTMHLPNASNNYHRKLGMALRIAIPAFFCITLAALGSIIVKKWKDSRGNRELKGELVTGPKKFTYKELLAATREFHSSRIIGSGAFGDVYKALFISTGMIAAVKRSTHSHEEGKTEFLAELSIIACLRHKNLVQLQGWCAERGELLLVYEFMPNGSLDKVLYSESGVLLTWSHRLNIVMGLASAITYLHQECEQQVIHRDIKASNIMLDACFNARLGDFGLARLTDHDKSPVSTLTAGTMGYLAPEYLQYGTATEKTDVYSFGVVVLEVACGKRPIERESNTQKMVNLVDSVWKLHGDGRIIEAADKRLNGKFKEEEMTKLLLIGLSCAHPDSKERPSMRRVLQLLENKGRDSERLFVPKMKPTLTFSCGLSVDDIVSDAEDCKV